MSGKSPALIALFAVLTAAGGLISVPAIAAPMTLQNLFTILSGALLGPAGGALSQAVYIVMGVAGLPVFSGGGSGIGHLLGPTGGYLIGFIGAAYVSGIFALRGKVLAGFAAGIIFIYLTGLPWLKFWLQLSWIEAFVAGAAIFIPGDIIKIIAALGIYRGVRSSGVLEGTRKWQ